MARDKLTATAIKAAGSGKLHDGGGLFLAKRDRASGSWVWRYTHLGQRRDMGLGAWPDLSLAAARAERDRWAAVRAGGRDPLSVREAERSAEKAALAVTDPTLAEAVDVVFEAIAPTLRGGGVRGRWRSPLDLHLLPKLGKRRISTLAPQDLRDAVRPIWRTMHPTAQKVVQRTRIVFTKGRLMGFPCDPFTVEAAVHMLGEHRHEVAHVPTTPWQDVPAMVAALGDGSSARAVRWIALTLVRSHAARGALVSETDGAVWTVPPDRIKAKAGQARAFRVPLSPPALAMVEQAREFGDVMFPGYSGRPVTDVALEKALRGTGFPGTPHGLRSSFRTWVQDTDACSWEVAETILGHRIGSTVERSYARSDLLERRAPVMDAWGRFVSGAASGEVVTLRR